MHETRFSLIVPVHNVQAYVARCLHSIQRQTDTNWEAVVIDDGSTDDSLQIAQSFAEQDPRFRVFSQPNAGVAAARNLGLSEVSGNWVWFIDSDDCIEPWSLTYLRGVFASEPTLDYVTFRLNAFSGERAPEPSGNMPGIDDLVLHNSSTAAGLQSIVGGAPREACLTCYRRAFIGDQRFESFALGEDTLFAKQIATRAQRTARSSARLYAYFQRPGSATRSPRLSSVLDYLGVCERLLDLRQAKGGKLTDVFAHVCFEFGVVDGLARIQALHDVTQRNQAYQRWQQFVSSYLQAFGPQARSALRLRLTVLTAWRLPGLALFYSKTVLRRQAQKRPWVARAVRALR